MSISAGVRAPGAAPAGAHHIELLVQRQPVDPDVLQAIVHDEGAALGCSLSVRWVDALDASAIGAGTPGSSLVLATHPDQADLDWLTGAGHNGVIRLDLALREPDRSCGLRCHIRGRGIDGARWALRAAHHHARHAALRVAYGRHPEQFGELRLPEPAGGASSGAGRSDDHRAPLVVLLHGGFWRSRWELDLMDALAIDLAGRGLATWNVEYRRPDRHGWAATVGDVSAAIRHLPELAAAHPIDAGRIAVAGHSAGGQLAVQVSADLFHQRGPGAAPRLVVSLAGLVDLVETHRRDLGNGAVPMALGGTPQQVPQVYRQASPMLRLPVDLRQLVVIGDGDSPDLREMSRRYVRAAGPRTTLLEDQGDHFSVIDPASVIWQRAAQAMSDALCG